MLTGRGATRGRLLSSLRGASQPLSGEALSASLGVSRVAVWRHVRSLQAVGYPIEAGRRGYRLQAGTDLLLPWEFPRLAERLVWTAETVSTMDDARRLAERGRPAGAVVVAEAQSRGRGRNGRSWSSGCGEGLYATFLRREAISAALLPRVPLAAALAVAATLERLYGLRPRLKWPNDVLLGGLKVAGVLVEASTEADRLRWYTVGVGINVRGRPRVPGAVSLERALGRAVSRAGILDALCGEMDRRLDDLTAAALAAEWSGSSDTAGRGFEVSTPLGVVRGRALGVDDWGALVIAAEKGGVVHVPPAACLKAKEVT